MKYEIKSQEKLTIGFRELWAYRELFYFFTWRDIKVKYKQTFLGFLWAILQPLFMTVVFTLFISESVTKSTNLTIPYPIFAFSGMLMWGIFSSGMSNAANSMVTNSNIIKKIYFPRLIIPISSILVALFDSIFACAIFIVLLLFYQIEIDIHGFLMLPVGVFITCLSAMGCGTLLAALNIKYRDVRYIIPFLVQGLLFLTPVLYPTGISDNILAQIILKLNPISGALELVRGCIVGYNVDYETVFLSLCSSLALLILGILYFRKTESFFADLA